MGSILSVSFVILINGVASSFLRPVYGLRQGFHLALMLFLIVFEGFGRVILAARHHGDLVGLPFDNKISLTHVLFVDDIVMVTDGFDKSILTLNDVLSCFCRESRMLINDDKSTLLYA